MYLCKYFPFVDNRTVVVVVIYETLSRPFITRFTAELSWALEFTTTASLFEMMLKEYLENSNTEVLRNYLIVLLRTFYKIVF